MPEIFSAVDILAGTGGTVSAALRSLPEAAAAAAFSPPVAEAVVVAVDVVVVQLNVVGLVVVVVVVVVVERRIGVILLAEIGEWWLATELVALAALC